MKQEEQKPLYQPHQISDYNTFQYCSYILFCTIHYSVWAEVLPSPTGRGLQRGLGVVGQCGAGTEVSTPALHRFSTTE